MDTLVLVTNDQKCWKTESGELDGLTPLWGSVHTCFLLYDSGLRFILKSELGRVGKTQKQWDGIDPIPPKKCSKVGLKMRKVHM